MVVADASTEAVDVPQTKSRRKLADLEALHHDRFAVLGEIEVALAVHRRVARHIGEARETEGRDIDLVDAALEVGDEVFRRRHAR